MIFNNHFKNRIYKPKIALINVNNFVKHSLYPITNGKNFINNKNPCHNFEYIKNASISSDKQISNNLSNSFNNNRKLYKNKIKRKIQNNNNDNTNNKEYFSAVIDLINKKSKMKKLLVHKPNIYNKTIDSVINREIL